METLESIAEVAAALCGLTFMVVGTVAFVFMAFKVIFGGEY